MRIETGGRSAGVPHFARRLCLLVRQTCEKIAHAVRHSFSIFVFIVVFNQFAISTWEFRAHSFAILSTRRSAISNATRKMYSRENMHITLFRRNRKERAVIFHVGIHFNGFAAIHAIQYANDASRPTGASIIKRPILAIRSYITGVLLQSNLNFWHKRLSCLFFSLFYLSLTMKKYAVTSLVLSIYEVKFLHLSFRYPNLLDVIFFNQKFP